MKSITWYSPGAGKCSGVEFLFSPKNGGVVTFSQDCGLGKVAKENLTRDIFAGAIAHYADLAIWELSTTAKVEISIGEFTIQKYIDGDQVVERVEYGNGSFWDSSIPQVRGKRPFMAKVLDRKLKESLGDMSAEQAERVRRTFL